MFQIGCVSYCRHFVRIAEGADDTEDAEGVVVSPIFDFTSKPVCATITLFFRVLCVLCVFRDSDV